MYPVIQHLITYWKEIYEGSDPVEKAFQGLPSNVRDRFEKEYFPQPFYGYFNEDMGGDDLVPLINPGPIREDEVRTFFPSGSFEGSKSLWNDHIRWRHTTTPNTKWFCNREEEFARLLGKKNWRGQRFKQCLKVAGKELGFMHTIEFFPFHSPTWNVGKNLRENWLYDLPSTSLSINTIEEITVNRLVKHIIGIGLPRVELLSKYPQKFKQEVKPHEIPGSNGGRGQFFYKFKPINKPNALPIVIYSSCAMNLPSNEKRNAAGIQKLRESWSYHKNLCPRSCCHCY